MTSDLHTATGDVLTAADVYGIWRIRDVVFAVEQQCDEPDVDDLDLLASTTHLWFDDATGLSPAITSYVRVLTDPDGAHRIGRVCTLLEHRGQRLSAQLIAHAVQTWGDGPMRLNAQAHLEAWYGRFGFTVSGDHFMEAGIDHVPMRLN